MYKEVPIKSWKTYLRFMTVNSAAPGLSKKFADENFNFFGRYLSGAKERQPRWKTCVQATDNNLGEALGEEYIKRAFKPEARARMLQPEDLAECVWLVATLPHRVVVDEISLSSR